MSKNTYLSCCDGRHLVTRESRHRGFFGATQDDIIAREWGAGKDEDKMHLNVHIVKQKNKAKPSMPRLVVQHSPDVLYLTSSDCITAKKSGSVTGDILMGDNGQSSVVVEGLPAEILSGVKLSMGLVVTRLSLSVSE